MPLPDFKLGTIATAFGLFMGLGGYFGAKKKEAGKEAVVKAEDLKTRRRVGRLSVRVRKLEDGFRTMGGDVRVTKTQSADTNREVRTMAAQLNRIAGRLHAAGEMDQGG